MKRTGFCCAFASCRSAGPPRRIILHDHLGAGAVRSKVLGRPGCVRTSDRVLQAFLLFVAVNYRTYITGLRLLHGFLRMT